MRKEKKKEDEEKDKEEEEEEGDEGKQAPTPVIWYSFQLDILQFDDMLFVVLWSVEGWWWKMGWNGDALVVNEWRMGNVLIVVLWNEGEWCMMCLSHCGVICDG